MIKEDFSKGTLDEAPKQLNSLESLISTDASTVRTETDEEQDEDIDRKVALVIMGFSIGVAFATVHALQEIRLQRSQISEEE